MDGSKKGTAVQDVRRAWQKNGLFFLCASRPNNGGGETKPPVHLGRSKCATASWCAPPSALRLPHCHCPSAEWYVPRLFVNLMRGQVLAI